MKMWLSNYVETKDQRDIEFILERKLIDSIDAEPNYFFDHLANIEIDENNQIEMGGING